MPSSHGDLKSLVEVLKMSLRFPLDLMDVARCSQLQEMDHEEKRFCGFAVDTHNVSYNRLRAQVKINSTYFASGVLNSTRIYVQ